jgi:nucleoside-diphosphate-sugar epimerase
LRGRTFDIVVATYGRLALLPRVLAGVTDRVISVGGATFDVPDSVPADEASPRTTATELFRKIIATEEAIMRAQERGVFDITHLRYPHIFGPRHPAPKEWSVIRRILDGRRVILVQEGGLYLQGLAYSENAADALLHCVDRQDFCRGSIFNVADDPTPSAYDIISGIAQLLGADVRVVSVPIGLKLPHFYHGLGRNLRFNPSDNEPVKHEMISSRRLREELGYRQRVPFETAIERTVAWYCAHRPPPRGDEERRMGDTFDYPAEDQLIAGLDEAISSLSGLELLRRHDWHHPYDHPKAGEAR